MNVGDRVTLKIIDFDEKGRGIGKEEGKVIFLDGGLIGDVVEGEITRQKKNYFTGTICHMISPSPNRIGMEKEWGGFPLANLDYAAELAWKERRVRDALARIGGFDGEITPIVGMELPTGYRNHMQFHKVGDSFGLYDRSGDLRPLAECPYQREAANRVLTYVHDNPDFNHFTTLGLRTNRGGDVMALFVGTRPLKNEDFATLITLAEDCSTHSIYYSENHDSRFHYGRHFQHIYGAKTLTEHLYDFTYEISPASFFQVNTTQTEQMIRIMEGHLAGRTYENVLDLYCGMGTLTLPLSTFAQNIIGIEVVERAIEDGRKIAAANGRNVRYIAGDVEKILPRLVEEEHLAFDLVSVDPPRKGLGKNALDLLLELAPENIHYISCNPATLARDLKHLGEKYHVESIVPVDMFPRTVHVESVVLMSRK